MTLILHFVALLSLGEIAAFLIGWGAEYQFGSIVGLIVFLAAAFSVFFFAWHGAVRLTEPKRA